MSSSTITLTRREALTLSKLLSSNPRAESDHDAREVLGRLDRFLIGLPLESKLCSGEVSGNVLHCLKPVRTGAAGSTRRTLEFEIDEGSVNVLIDGEITVENVVAIMREPALLRIRDGKDREHEFIVPQKLPADWSAALLPSREIAVRSVNVS